MEYKELIKKGEDYAKSLVNFLDSGQLPEARGSDWYEHAFYVATEIDDLNKELKDVFLLKSENKANLVTGELRIISGIYDFKETGAFTMHIFEKYYLFSIENAQSQFASMLATNYGVTDSDIILNHWNIDTQLDTLQFSFAFQTDQNFETPKNDIALITPVRKYTGGYFYQNKAYFRNQIGTIPDKIFEWALYGFALPYNFINKPDILISKIGKSAGPMGELADLRSFSTAFKTDIDLLVTNLKIMGWNKILTQWGRWIKNNDGTYRKY